MTHYPDNYGNYIITQEQSLPFGLILGSVFFVAPFLANLLANFMDGTDSGTPTFIIVICFALGAFVILIGLKRVPYKHYGLRTFGKPVDKIPEGQLVYEQGLHWIYPWCGLRIESFEPIAKSYQFDNIQTYNNIIFSIKVNILYRMGNASLYSQHKTEADGRLKSGVLQGIQKLIIKNKFTDREMSQNNETFTDSIFSEIDYIKDECGIFILKNSIEWIKPLNEKIVDNFVEESKFTTQIKRVVSLAKELNITAEEAFRIEGIRIGLIKSNDNVYNFAGAKAIIEAAASLLRK
jgi:hypothetical protein